MESKSLRSIVTACIQNDSSSVFKALKSVGISLTQQEIEQLKTGNLEGFTDKELGERFNSKVLTILGICYPGTEDFGLP